MSGVLAMGVDSVVLVGVRALAVNGMLMVGVRPSVVTVSGRGLGIPGTGERAACGAAVPRSVTVPRTGSICSPITAAEPCMYRRRAA